MQSDEIELSLPIIADSEDKTSPLKNRIRKNYRHLRKWAKRTETNCFRIYDREIPHYPLAIDYYAGRLCVQHFLRTRDMDEPPAELVAETNDALCSIFASTPELIHWRNRIKREKTQQYEKSGAFNEFFTVVEYGVKFKINLLDYLDTGLFLDHRETRKMVASIAAGKRVLNLFAYTCSFSVHAALAGAVFTKSVDMSNTYTDWGRDNFLLNSLVVLPHHNPPPNQRFEGGNVIVRADCLKFLIDEVISGAKYDIIIIDPPTISRSKKMDRMFDVQEDYIFLINKGLALLADQGVIFFSTNSLKFSFDPSNFPGAVITEISHKTIPLDFSKSRIHRCWKIAYTKI